MCPGPGSNRHGHYCPQDFKSGVSTNSTTGATLKKTLQRGGSLSERRDSNPRPQPWQGCALPAELLSRLGGQIYRPFNFPQQEGLFF